MSIDWQLVVVAGVGVLAVAFLGLSAWRTWFGRARGCGAGCGKCAAPAPPDGAPGRVSLPQV
jgi:hypothetical protein